MMDFLKFCVRDQLGMFLLLLVSLALATTLITVGWTEAGRQADCADYCESVEMERLPKSGSTTCFCRTVGEPVYIESKLWRKDK